MSYYSNESPLVGIFNTQAQTESSLESKAQFDTVLFEGKISGIDSDTITSDFNMFVSGDIRYSFSGGGGLRSVSYFELDGTNTTYRGHNENGGGSAIKGVTPEMIYCEALAGTEIKLETKKKSTVTISYVTNYTRVIGLVQ